MSSEPANISEVDPNGFYSVAATCRILRISRPTIYSRIDTIARDVFGRIPGWEVLRLGGIDLRVEMARTPKGDVRKRIRDLI